MTDQATMRRECDGKIDNLHNDIDRLEATSANFVAAFAMVRTASMSLTNAAAAVKSDADSRIVAIAERVNRRLA